MYDFLHYARASDGLRRVFRFCCIGVLNTGIAFCLYIIFSEFINRYAANAFSWGAGCVCSYFLNKTWTFRATDKGFLPMLRFAAVNLCSLGLGLMMMYLLTSFGLGRILSYIFSLPVTVTASYLGYRFWSFKHVGSRV